MYQKEKNQSGVFVPLRHFTAKSFLNRMHQFASKVCR